MASSKKGGQIVQLTVALDTDEPIALACSQLNIDFLFIKKSTAEIGLRNAFAKASVK